MQQERPAEGRWPGKWLIQINEFSGMEH